MDEVGCSKAWPKAVGSGKGKWLGLFDLIFVSTESSTRRLLDLPSIIIFWVKIITEIKSRISRKQKVGHKRLAQKERSVEK